MGYFDQYRRGITSVRLMVDYFCEQGVEARALLAGTGLSERDLQNPDAEIAATRELQVVANILSTVPDARNHAVSLGARYHFSAYGFWGYGLVCCGTVAEALSLALRYLPLTYAFAGIRYREQGNQGLLCFDAPALEPEVARFVLVRDMMAASVLVRELVGEDFRVLQLNLASADLPGDALAEALNCPVSYHHPVNEASFNRILLGRPLPQANPVTAAMCEQQCRELLARRRCHSEARLAVERYLHRLQGGKPALADVAGQLNMSERTLKRHLQQEGTSFRGLIERYRRAEACRLLEQTRMPVSEIAQRLGFSDTSTFTQAFNRWFRMPPSHYRATAEQNKPATSEFS